MENNQEQQEQFPFEMQQQETQWKQQQQLVSQARVAQQQLQLEQRLELQGAPKEKKKFPESMSPGYRFSPTDEVLIMQYLKKKFDNEKLPDNRIHEVHIYDYDPQELTKIYKWDRVHTINKWYFFSTRSRKYPKGDRPNRSTPNGYWKPTGADHKIFHNGNVVGFKKSLDFYKGLKRLDWKMHEYRIEQKGSAPNRMANGEMNMQLDGLVLCKIYLNTRGKKGNAKKGAENIISNNVNENTQSPEGDLQDQNNDLQNQNNYVISQMRGVQNMINNNVHRNAQHRAGDLQNQNTNVISHLKGVQYRMDNNFNQDAQNSEGSWQNQNNNVISHLGYVQDINGVALQNQENSLISTIQFDGSFAGQLVHHPNSHVDHPFSYLKTNTSGHGEPSNFSQGVGSVDWTHEKHMQPYNYDIEYDYNDVSRFLGVNNPPSSNVTPVHEKKSQDDF